jgi:hypothetical protein
MICCCELIGNAGSTPAVTIMTFRIWLGYRYWIVSPNNNPFLELRKDGSSGPLNFLGRCKTKREAIQRLLKFFPSSKLIKGRLPSDPNRIFYETKE